MALNRHRAAAATTLAASALVLALSACGDDASNDAATPELVAKSGQRGGKVYVPSKGAAISRPAGVSLRAAQHKTSTVVYKSGQRAGFAVLHKSGGHGG